jgi:soluble lytic murein transglycosylase-like protein
VTHESKWFRPEIEAIAHVHSLDADLVEAIVRTESSGLSSAYRYEHLFWLKYLQGKPEYDGANPRRVSASYGLMQVMYPVAKELGLTDPPEALFLPATGIAFGCRHFARLLIWANHNVDKALSAYNGGKGTAMSWPYKNQDYVDKVKTHLANVKGEAPLGE